MWKIILRSFIWIILFNIFSFADESKLSKNTNNYHKSFQEEEIQLIIDQYLGVGRAILYVRYDISESQTKYITNEVTETQYKKPVDSKHQKSLMPGYFNYYKDIPEPEQKYNKINSINRTVIQKNIPEKITKIFCLIVIDTEVSQKDRLQVKEIASISLGMNEARGDYVIIMPVPLVKDVPKEVLDGPSLNLKDVSDKTSLTLKKRILNIIENQETLAQYFKYVFFVVVGIVILFLLFIFLFVLVRSNNRSREKVLLRKNEKEKDSDLKNPKLSINSNNDSGKGSERDIVEEDSSEEVMDLSEKSNKEVQLFSFVNKDNIEKLAVILKRESNDSKMMVMSFLNETLASRLFELFSKPDQLELVLESSKERLLSPDEVLSFEDTIRRQIEFVSGVRDLSLTMLEKLPESRSRAILEEVALVDNDVYTRIRSQLYVFNDIKYLNKKQLQRIIKQCGEKKFAIALQGKDKEFLAYIFENLTEGMAEILKQSFKLAGHQPEDKVDSIRMKVVGIIKALSRDGEIPPKHELIKGKLV